MNRSRSARRAGLLVPVAAACLLAASGCASAAGPTADEVVARLGAVPIPTAAAPATPVPAAPGHPQIMAMGGAVAATLPGTGTGTVTALGPQIDLPAGARLPVEQARAAIRVEARTDTGTVALQAGDFTSRDDHGRDIPLDVVGPAAATSDPTRPATLQLAGTFHSGAAQITWRYRGAVVAVWTFTVELD
ncbi:hypothetical protein [Pseudonocardia acidicola]|uniref:Lipoprotein n=1 Tax=Pseudonocardia acidicola TaxID=2724939 RepID=A0ABX1S3N0_9PSEU|nr:hypothetical protein [Pseudonocardia acidicola]NMH96189.1 hypothetical protein [Pseudonocardia acidicola]